MEKKYKIMWTASLLVISGITIVIAGCNIVLIELPDIVKRILGAADLISIPVLIFASIKLRILKKEQVKND